MPKVIDKINNWRQRPIMMALATLMSGQIIGQALSLASTPIVSRLYTRSDFGQFALISSSAAIICAVSQLGLSSAMMIPKEDGEAKKVFTCGFWTQLIIASIIVMIFLAVSPSVHLFKVTISYPTALVLLYVFVLLTNLMNLLRVYMNRNKLYNALFWNSLIAAMSTVCVTIPLGIAGKGFIGLISASLVSAAVCSMQMLLKANPFIKVNIAEIWKEIKRYKEFSLFQYPANMIRIFSVQLPNQMLGRGFGSAPLGSYAMSQKVFNLPLHLIATPVSTVYFKTAVEYHQDNKDLAGFTFSLVSKIMLLAFIPVVVLISFGEQIFTWVLGPQWQEAGLIAAILGIQYVLVFCTNCTSYCRVSIGRQRINLLLSVLEITVIAGSLATGIFAFTGLIPVLACYAIGNSLFQIINMAVNFYCLKKHLVKYLFFVGVYCVLVGGLGLLLRTLV